MSVPSPPTSESSTTQTMPLLYKVTDFEGRSCHGGTLQWPLPTQDADGSWTPGDWQQVTGDLILCQNALHLTDQPAGWYQAAARCWRAEYRGETVGEIDGGWQSKIGVREARLVAPVEWDAVAVWTSGEHTLNAGIARASGSATVEASGSATVWAYGSATVEAYGSATVRAYDSATVRAYGSATVRASDSAMVEAYDSATVISTPWHRNSAQVALSQMAAHVDRRGNRVVCRTAEVPS